MLLAATAAAAAIAASPQCSWDNPGADPYKGTVAAAIASYEDIPLRHRAALWVQVQMAIPHAAIRITKNGIEGPDSGRIEKLRDMHWGSGASARVCRGGVSRSAWAHDHYELAMVYCSGDYGIAIPATCNNVARVDCYDLDHKKPVEPFSVPQEPEVRPLPPPHPLPPQRPREVPEPGTLVLIGLALVLMGVKR